MLGASSSELPDESGELIDMGFVYMVNGSEPMSFALSSSPCMHVNWRWPKHRPCPDGWRLLILDFDGLVPQVLNQTLQNN